MLCFVLTSYRNEFHHSVDVNTGSYSKKDSNKKHYIKVAKNSKSRPKKATCKRLNVLYRFLRGSPFNDFVAYRCSFHPIFNGFYGFRKSFRKFRYLRLNLGANQPKKAYN